MEADRQGWEEVYAGARARWPNIDLPLEAFTRHAARLGLDAGALVERAGDLYIVAAVLDGAPHAMARFDEMLTVAAAATGRVDRAPAFVDEVRQELRVTLLTGADPKLRTYLGTGALADWLRVVATRLALNLKRGQRIRAVEEPLDALLGGEETEQLKRFYIDDMRGALRIGFRRLSPRERTLLRLHFVDGLNIERIGAIYGVHRATVARWIVGIRERLFQETKIELGAKHGLDTADVRSLYRVMAGDVHLSLSRILVE